MFRKIIQATVTILCAFYFIYIISNKIILPFYFHIPEKKLADIVGLNIGNAIRKLEKYGSPIFVFSATSKELSKIPGLGETRAKKIKKMLEYTSKHKKISNQKTLHD